MIYSMFAMTLLTFSVGFYLFKLRLDAVRKGDVRLSVFKLLSSGDLPVKMQQASRNYSNLFEMPVLFYCVAILGLVLHIETPLMVALSWFFVVSRVAHSWIHMTSNNVIRRVQAFMVGNVCVLVMWIILVWKYSTNHYQ